MKKLNRNQWIAVFVSLVIVIVFFTTGRDFVSFFNSGNRAKLNTEQIIDSTSNEINTMDSTPSNSFSSSVSGFEIQDITVGAGLEAMAGKIVTVNYSGAFTDGRVFDSSYKRGTPFEFTLGAGQVIAGWDKGFDGMKVGGKRRLIVPPAFGYGPAGVPNLIPPNSILIFEVELLGVR